MTHEDEGRVKVLVVFLRVAHVELAGFISIDSKEVSTRVICPQRAEEFLESRIETGIRLSSILSIHHLTRSAYHFWSSWMITGSRVPLGG